MKNWFFKLISVTLVLLIFMTSLTTIAFAETDYTTYSVEVDGIVNPIYADTQIDNASAFSLAPSKYYSSRLNFKPEHYTNDEQSIVANLREAMTEREAIFNVYYMSTYDCSNNLEDILNDWIELAFVENENANQGDYLRYVWRGCPQITVSITEYDNKHYYHIPLKILYYTTKAQEQEFDAKLKNVIDSFGFDDATTSKQKSDKIYEYITKNVSYDYTNLYNDSYTLKFSAYAALINGTAVCQGYATLFYRIARECGLATRVITGKSSGQNHAWNIIKIGKYYYFVDSTWDAGQRRYLYYLKGSGDFPDHALSQEFLENEFLQRYPISYGNYDNDISKMEIELSYNTSVYDGTAKEPEVTIKGLKEFKDFTVEYTNNVNVGTATVTVTAIGAYRGTDVVSFEICPQATQTVNAKLSGRTDANLSWKKVTGAVGYNIYRKTTGSYSLIGSSMGLSYTAKGLSSNTKYTFKIVAYYLDGNVKKESTQYKTATVTTLRNLSAPSKVTLSLYGHDDVSVSWTKVSYAKGYYVYYKKSTDKNYSYVGKTTATSFKKSNLSNGVKYTFKVVPYGLSGDTVILDDSYKTATIYTLKKISAPKVTKSSSKVKVSWSNISGESGYQISKSTSKSKTNIVATYSTTSGKSKKITAKKGKTYYYKVRAYKTVNGKKIYGPWSSVKKYKLK